MGQKHAQGCLASSCQDSIALLLTIFILYMPACIEAVHASRFDLFLLVRSSSAGHCNRPNQHDADWTLTSWSLDLTCCSITHMHSIQSRVIS